MCGAGGGLQVRPQENRCFCCLSVVWHSVVRLPEAAAAAPQTVEATFTSSVGTSTVSLPVPALLMLLPFEIGWEEFEFYWCAVPAPAA